MCISAIFIKTLDNSISFGFNREESPYRKFKSPTCFKYKKTKIISGIDKEAGGTWLGLNEEKIFCFVTNRYDKKVQTKTSRGLLVLNLLSKKTIEECFDYLKKELSNNSYDGFNLIFGNVNKVFYSNNIDKKIKVLGKGNYYLSNSEINDKNSKRIKVIQRECLKINSKNFKEEMKKVLASKNLKNNYSQRVSSNILKIEKNKLSWFFSNINDEFEKWQNPELDNLFK